MRRWLVQKAGSLLASRPRVLRVLLEGTRVDGLTFATPYGQIEVPTNAGSILDAFLAGGYHEEEVVQNFLKLSADVPTLLNIGANVGTTARIIEASGLYARIWCFEPELRNFACLVRNLAGRANVECRNQAAGSAPGLRDLYLNTRSTGRHSFKTDYAMGAIPVEVTTVAAAVADGTPFDIFMDVEGWELEVLRGAEPRLQSCGICALEWNGHLYTPDEVRDVMSIIQDAGFDRALDLRNPAHALTLADVASLRRQHQIAFARMSTGRKSATGG